MNKLLRIAACICSLTLTWAGAMAQSPEPSSSAGLDAFVGSGTCTGTVMAMEKDPGRATTSKYVAEKILDGKWVEIRYTEESTPANPKPFKVVQYIGYDTAKKRYLAVALDNSGSGYSTGTTSGWKGDSFTVDNANPSDPKSPALRDVFTKSDGAVSHTGLIRDKDGKWVKTDQETCSRG